MTITDEMLKKINASTIRKHFSEVNRQVRSEFFTKAYLMKSADLKKRFKELFKTHKEDGKIVAYIPKAKLVKNFMDNDEEKIFKKFDIEKFKAKFPKPKEKKVKEKKVKLVIKDKKPKKKKMTKKEIDKQLKKFKKEDDKKKENKKKQNKTDDMFKKKNQKKSPQKLKIDKENIIKVKETLKKTKTVVKDKSLKGKIITDYLRVINLINKYDDKNPIGPFPYSSNPQLDRLGMLYVLKENKNDCFTALFPKPKTGSMSKAQRSYIRRAKKGNWEFTLGVAPGFLANYDGRKDAKKLVDVYLECKKRKKMLIIPMSMIQKKGSFYHRNMLVFNYHRNELERFEPHGGKTGAGDGAAKNISARSDKTVQDKLLKSFNKELKKRGEPELKYVKPEEICPLENTSVEKFLNLDGDFISWFDTGVQSYEGHSKNAVKYTDLKEFLEIKSDKDKIFKNEKWDNIPVVIKSEDGYCSAWSWWWAYNRLKYPKQKGRDLYKDLLNEFLKRIRKKETIRYYIDFQYYSEKSKKWKSQYYNALNYHKGSGKMYGFVGNYNNFLKLPNGPLSKDDLKKYKFNSYWFSSTTGDDPPDFQNGVYRKYIKDKDGKVKKDMEYINRFPQLNDKFRLVKKEFKYQSVEDVKSPFKEYIRRFVSFQVEMATDIVKRMKKGTEAERKSYLIYLFNKSFLSSRKSNVAALKNKGLLPDWYIVLDDNKEDELDNEYLDIWYSDMEKFLKN